MTVSFDQVTVERPRLSDARHRDAGDRGRRHPRRSDRAGAGAGVGAIIGGILGGVKGAVLGVLIGGGGTIAATEGKEVDLPQGTVLRVRVDSPAADLQAGVGGRLSRTSSFNVSHRASRGASIVFFTSRSVCAADRNHASNCDGGG